MSTPVYCEDLDCDDFFYQLVFGDEKYCRVWDVDLKSVDPAHTIPCAQCEYLEEGEPE